MAALPLNTFINPTTPLYAPLGYPSNSLQVSTLSAPQLTNISSINSVPFGIQTGAVGGVSATLPLSTTTGTLLFSTTATFTGNGGIAQVQVPVRATLSTFTGSGGLYTLGVISQAGVGAHGPSYCAQIPAYPGANTSTIATALSLNTTINAPLGTWPLCVYAFPQGLNGTNLTGAFMSITNSASQGSPSASATNTLQLIV